MFHARQRHLGHLVRQVHLGFPLDQLEGFADDLFVNMVPHSIATSAWTWEPEWDPIAAEAIIPHYKMETISEAFSAPAGASLIAMKSNVRNMQSEFCLQRRCTWIAR